MADKVSGPCFDAAMIQFKRKKVKCMKVPGCDDLTNSGGSGDRLHEVSTPTSSPKRQQTNTDLSTDVVIDVGSSLPNASGISKATLPLIGSSDIFLLQVM